MKKFFPFFIAIVLSCIAWVRTDFSPDKLAPSQETVQTEIPEEMVLLLDQPYRFLGKGRQAFVFVSQDGKTVIKFFNLRYFSLPWYSFCVPGEVKKRAQRELFFLQSYPLAANFFPEETALLYVHLGKSRSLPSIQVIDSASRLFEIDLNQVSFALQKRGVPLYDALDGMSDEASFLEALDQFFSIIAHRIGKGIRDADQDIEHNFGVVEGKVCQLDPGRWFSSDLLDPQQMSYEWWSGTHNLRKWIERTHPDRIALFDRRLQAFSVGSELR